MGSIRANITSVIELVSFSEDDPLVGGISSGCVAVSLRCGGPLSAVS